MIKSERIGGVKEVVSLGPSIYNIPHEQRDDILNKISRLIVEDAEVHQLRNNESIKLAEKFVARSNS